MKRFTLQLEDDDDYVLVGISSNEKDYRLCWLINQSLGLNFVRIEDIEIIQKRKNLKLFYSVYQHVVEEDLVNLYIISNNRLNESLVTECKHADYLFMIKGPFQAESKDELISKLKLIKNIMLVFEIELDEISSFSKKNLLF